MKLPILAIIIFIFTVVMTAPGLIAYATSYAMDSEYYSSNSQIWLVIQMVIGVYFIVFSIAALSKLFWGIAGYRLGLVGVGLYWIVAGAFDPGGFDVIGFLFMLLLSLGFLFPVWKYLGSKAVMEAYAQQDGSLNSEKPGASLH